MKPESARQWVNGSVVLGSGQTSVALLAARAGCIFYVTSIYASVEVSAAQSVTVASTTGGIILLASAINPTGTTGWGPLFRGIALPLGIGITATASGAGNQIVYVFEGYYELVSNS